MESKTETALEYYHSGFNCAQSVAAAFCEKYGCDNESAMKLASGLGGGLHSGEVCGAVSGAVMVIGLKYGQYIADDLAAKRECYAKTEEFVDRFKLINGDVTCRALLDFDIRADREQIREKNLLKVKCVGFIADAANLLEELGY